MEHALYRKFAAALSLSLVCAFVGSASAAADLRITEVFAGLTGPDGTEDWFELTNVGDMTADTGAYWYDDDSATIVDGGQLDSILLAPGASAVFLVETPQDAADAAAMIQQFTDVWGAGITLGFTNGGGGLGQGGDTVNLLDGADNVLDSVAFTAAFGNVPETMEVVNGTLGLSVLGQRGAYAAVPFENENFAGGMITLIGSPGTVVPEPATLALLVLGGLGVAHRRR